MVTDYKSARSGGLPNNIESFSSSFKGDFAVSFGVHLENGIWFDKAFESDGYNYMWSMAVKENVEYSAHVFASGVYVQKGIDESHAQPVNAIQGKVFGENYYKIWRSYKKFNSLCTYTSINKSSI